MANKMSFVNQYRDAVNRLLDALDELERLQRMYDALGGDQWVDAGDVGSDLTLPEFRAAQNSARAVQSAFGNSNHPRNLYKLRR